MFLSNVGTHGPCVRWYEQTIPRYKTIRHFSNFYIKEDRIINGNKSQIYGNPLLLENPFKESVIIHRADTEDVIESKFENWMHLATNGGVLVGAFVSKKEKEILKSIMIILNNILISSCRDARSLRPLRIKELTLLNSDTRAVCPCIFEQFFHLGYL